MDEETERKFLVGSDFIFDPSKLPSKKIRQGYITTDLSGHTEVRLRETIVAGKAIYQITVKKGKGLTRTETEVLISEGQFAKFWPETEKRRIVKNRYEKIYNLSKGKFKLEIDVYGDLSEGKIIAEVEAEKEKVEQFIAPPGLKEVTGKIEYSNASIAIKGFPGHKKQTKKKKILEFEKTAGIKQLIKMIKEKTNCSNSIVTVFIAGGSASGKSTAVKGLEEAFGRDLLVISADNYYIGGRRVRELGIGFDDPEAVDLIQVRKDIELLQAGKPIQERIYEFGDDPSQETTRSLPPPKILVFEGLFMLQDQLKDLADIRVFFDIGFHGWLLRRLFRDPTRTNQKPKDILYYCSTVVEPKYRKWILSTRKNADIVIWNEYDPRIEAQRAGVYEFQIKFRNSAGEEAFQETLRRVGAERLASLEQTDVYYNPFDRNLEHTGESLRIREEAGSITVTYKGPKDADSSFRKRHKYEFGIDKKTKEKFLALYGLEIKTIKKTRTIYQLDGIVISLDYVVKISNEQESILGEFIEVRTTKEEDKGKIEKVVGRIGLKIENGIKESYVEL